MIIAKPTWQGEIKDLFANPYWISPVDRARVGQGWTGCMSGYLIDLSDPKSVQDWASTIYDHLSSRSMPLTSNSTHYWPMEALETFRHWANQGYRLNEASPFDEAARILPPGSSPTPLRVRRDLASLTQMELDAFRAQLDDIMQIGNPDPDAPWQIWAYLHTNWCLHYQEAFCLWHRAYLIYFEEQLRAAIPYWDWMAEDASHPDSPNAGLPQAFIDKTYIHPETGEERPNPLRYAAAKDGRSKACATGSLPGDACTFVQRNPLFYTTGEESQTARTKLFAMAEIFQQQVVDALKFKSFSVPQGSPGFPWANIPAFDPPQKDSLYPHRDENFDGAFEQPHDNYHGWIGEDMADNAYTAFDPIFLCFHANIDRMLELWIRSNPTSQYTTGFPLRPFVGTRAAEIDESSPEQWRNTSLGDMAQDSRHLGYDYGAPVATQFKGRAAAGETSGAQSTSPASTQTHASGVSLGSAWVIFDGVKCTHDSYAIDVFLGGEAGEARADNPAYVGRFSRIGMGLVDDKNRCVRRGVSRSLDAQRAAAALNLSPGSDPGLSIRVHDLHSGEVLSEDLINELPGFQPFFHWGDQRLAPISPDHSSTCCH